MSNHATLSAALLTAFNLADSADPVAVADAAATVLIAFAEVVRGPAPVLGQLSAIQAVADPMHTELIAEVRALTATLKATQLANLRAASAIYGSNIPATGAAASGLPG